MTIGGGWIARATPDSANLAVGSFPMIRRGAAVALLGPAGWIDGRDELAGLYVHDIRVLKTWRLLVDGVEATTIQFEQGDRHVALIGVVPGTTTDHLLVRASLTLQPDHAELAVAVSNHQPNESRHRIELELRSDLADLFALRTGLSPDPRDVHTERTGSRLQVVGSDGDWSAEVTVVVDRVAEGEGGTFVFDATIAPQSTWRCSARVTCSLWDASDELVISAPALMSSSPALGAMWQRSVSDVASLIRSEDARQYLIAGVPWFTALFGRDALLAGMTAAPFALEPLAGSLEMLAMHQGTKVDERTCEEPGRIPHEIRQGFAAARSEAWGSIYYGSCDATPLFVIALEHAWRWGMDPERVRRLLPAAEAALAWTRTFGDGDGDGLIDYNTERVNGLTHQGWKDSPDGIRRPDGDIASGRVALVEVAGYQARAWTAIAALRAHFGGDVGAALAVGAEATEAIERFWSPSNDTYAVALVNGEPAASVTSNAGHLLWAEAIPEPRARSVAARLLRDDCFSGYGVRTLASSHPSYHPLSYHCGSVWPHDTAMFMGGLANYGFLPELETVALGLMGLAEASHGPLPELTSGLARAHGRPLEYRDACRPQAWAAAVGGAVVTALFGLRADAPGGRIVVRERSTERLEIVLTGLAVGDGDVNLTLAHGEVSADAEGLDVVVAEARP